MNNWKCAKCGGYHAADILCSGSMKQRRASRMALLVLQLNARAKDEATSPYPEWKDD